MSNLSKRALITGVTGQDGAYLAFYGEHGLEKLDATSCLSLDWVATYGKPIYNYFHRHGSITTSSVSDKTFHFLQHTEVIYPYIRENHPAITAQARYLRVRALAYSCLILDTADGEARQKYRDLYSNCCRQLKGHLGFILTNGLFSAKERVTNLLLALGLYRLLRRIYHGIR